MHSTVYKCFKLDDHLLEFPYAVKVVKENDEEKLLAHEKEFNIMKDLDHPNIVKTIELFMNKVKNEVH